MVGVGGGAAAANSDSLRNLCVILRDIGFLQHTFWMADDDDSVGGGERGMGSKQASRSVCSLCIARQFIEQINE